GGAGCGGGRAGGEGGCGRGRRVQRADGPEAGDVVVAPLAGDGGEEGQPGRQQVADLDVGGGVGAAVGEGDGERDGVADVGPGVAHHLGELQVGLLRRLGDAGRVVRRVRIELVAV